MTQMRLVGEIDAIYFESPSNFYKVMRVALDPDQGDAFLLDEIVMTGQFPSIHLDTLYEFFGKMTTHPKYGEQFAVERYQQLTPTSEEGLIDYLSSYRFKGIGPVLAERIVDKLGSKAIELIIDDPKSLEGITGLSAKNAKSLRQELLNYQGTERIYIQLNQWGFSAKLADRIFNYYDSRALEIIRDNPYELIQTIEGISFTKADQLALEFGIEDDALKRIAAAAMSSVYLICYEKGHTWISKDELFTQSRLLLEQSRNYLVSDQELEAGLDEALNQDMLICYDQRYAMASLFYAEVGISKQLVRQLTNCVSESFTEEEIDDALHQLMAQSDVQYDRSQLAALKRAIQSPVSIITGGPGTGKTTLINGLIQLHSLLHEYDLSELPYKTADEAVIHLAAPTGRAAKRMQEATGLPASTIHRLIGFTRESVTENFHAELLAGKLLIIDEMSMVDTWLMNWLLQAVPSSMQLVFVGDQDQLPSVGPGQVFTDLIQSKQIPVVSLKRIYRQGKGSTIIDLASHIRQGSLPTNFTQKQHDRSFIEIGTVGIAKAVHDIASFALKKGYNAMTMQVLAPMYKGEAGINRLNTVLQSLMNPAEAGVREIEFNQGVFREGDKVLQLVNNTEDEVFNGDVGMIQRIDYKDETESKTDEMVVVFEGEKEITYRRGDLNQLTLAYCVSIHKAQGSEYPLVIFPLVTAFRPIIQRNLLYTAVTRAQENLVLIGSEACFNQGVQYQQSKRQTFLIELMMEFEQDKLDETMAHDNVDSDLNLSNEVDSIEVFESSSVVEEIVLSEETIHQIDPMINMGELSPYDFMPK